MSRQSRNNSINSLASLVYAHENKAQFTPVFLSVHVYLIVNESMRASRMVMVHLFPSKMRRIPLSQIGWSFVDRRCGPCVGTSVFDGDYRLSWDFYHLSQRIAMVSCLAYLNGGKENLPPNLVSPRSEDGRYLHGLTRDVLRESLHQLRMGRLAPSSHQETVLSSQYDAICPLPSSKGPASAANIAMAKTIASSLSPVHKSDGGPPVVLPFVVRHTPMPSKSTKTPKFIRADRDAPRIMHFDTMSLEPSLVDSIRGKSMLLYDDVITWGNTSEAARNLLILAGASRVDVITIFSTGPLMRGAEYEYLGSSPDTDGFKQRIKEQSSPKLTKEDFRLLSSHLAQKDLLPWSEQSDHKSWHTSLGHWIEDHAPEIIPNDVIDV
jgi:hypothetical protein